MEKTCLGSLEGTAEAPCHLCPPGVTCWWGFRGDFHQLSTMCFLQDGEIFMYNPTPQPPNLTSAHFDKAHIKLSMNVFLPFILQPLSTIHMKY
ncbi:hypothetical protein AVEN_64489-1 [Araneus ventricosus]|uniref:Uncharacterized protein n=1 Tax=Araneus ventricosus TaxID=182803 RepID=A0A4Y2U8X8_ARAVE|nr:hypothetical protein AVEN_64489-1 [Araneus ventricosus]